MADEEVDWGVDEISEVNGVGAGAGITTADEDVLSLGDNDEVSPAQVEKKVPTGPRQSAESPNPTTAPAPVVDNSADNVDEHGQLLPDGWAKIVSRTHGKIFYHNASTKETSWEVPKAKTAAATETGSPAGQKKEENVAAPVNGQTATVEPSASVAPVAVSSARPAPSGPASWRSAQAKSSPQVATVPGPAQNGTRSRESSEQDRDAKRSRMASPPANGNSNRYPSRAEPPRRPRSPPPGPSNNRGSNFRNDPPSGPAQRSSAGPSLPVRQPAGPGLSNSNGFDRNRRDMDPPVRPARDREPPRGPRPENQIPVAPSRPFGVVGSNNAPVMNNRWGASASSNISNNGARQESAGASSGPLSDRMAKPAAPAPASAPVVDERAKLLEKKRKAQEELDKIKEEEDRLEKLEADKRADKDRDDARIKRREEEIRKEDEDRRRGPPPLRDFDRDRRPPGPVSRRSPGPPRREDDRDWRRVDDRRDFDRRRDDDRRGDYPPRRDRDPRDRPSMPPGGRSPFAPSSYRPGRDMSPPPLSARLDPYPPRSPPRRTASPPRAGGDSYRPDRDGPMIPPPGRDLATRMGPRIRDRSRERDPRPIFAEPMAGYAPRMPPRDRPLAERMTLDDRDRRYAPRDDRDRDRDRRW